MNFYFYFIIFENMRKLTLLSLFLTLLFGNCVLPTQTRNEKLIDETSEITDTFHLLTQFWQLTDADHPTSKCKLPLKRE